MGRIHDALKKAEEERRRKREGERGAPESRPDSSTSRSDEPIEARVPDRSRADRRPDHKATSKASKAAAKWKKKDDVTRRLPEADPLTFEEDEVFPDDFEAEVTDDFVRKPIRPGLPTDELAACVVVRRSPNDPRTEQFRAIKTNISAIRPAPRVIAVTSAGPGEGRTITCANLAAIFAEEGTSRVLVVDADLRNPTLHRMFGLADGKPGLVDVVEAEIAFKDGVYGTDYEGLDVMPAGRTSENPGALMGRPAMASVFRDWSRTYDHVIIDTPSIVDVNDAATVGLLVDGVVTVVRLGITPRRSAERAVDRLVDAGVQVLGCVVTHARDRGHAGASG